MHCLELVPPFGWFYAEIKRKATHLRAAIPKQKNPIFKTKTHPCEISSNPTDTTPTHHKAWWPCRRLRLGPPKACLGRGGCSSRLAAEGVQHPTPLHCVAQLVLTQNCYFWTPSSKMVLAFWIPNSKIDPLGYLTQKCVCLCFFWGGRDFLRTSLALSQGHRIESEKKSGGWAPGSQLPLEQARASPSRNLTPTACRQSRPRGLPGSRYRGWKCEIQTSHHERKPWLKPQRLLVFTGESFFQGVLGGAGFRPSTVWLWLKNRVTPKRLALVNGHMD